MSRSQRRRLSRGTPTRVNHLSMEMSADDEIVVSKQRKGKSKVVPSRTSVRNKEEDEDVEEMSDSEAEFDLDSKTATRLEQGEGADRGKHEGLENENSSDNEVGAEYIDDKQMSDDGEQDEEDEEENAAGLSRSSRQPRRAATAAKLALARGSPSKPRGRGGGKETGAKSSNFRSRPPISHVSGLTMGEELDEEDVSIDIEHAT
ncbi:unnamed protein product [Discosporangium mesarthrocarpum]